MAFKDAISSEGYHTIWTPGDGDCFFRTLEHLLNNGVNHKCIRQDIVDFITDNRSKKWVETGYECDRNLEENIPLTQHLSDMKKQAWATILEIIAAGFLFQKRIVTIAW
jgi:hypothetical protein